MHRTFRIILLVMMIVCTMIGVQAKPFTLVIDAGHGGHDVGCEGESIYEKDVNLSIALKLGKLIKKKYKDKVKVLYTRDKDEFVELNDRALKANVNNADLFISIHINSLDKDNKNRAKMNGSTVYVMDPSDTERNLGVIERRSEAPYIDRNGRHRTMKHNPEWAESQIYFEIEQLSRNARSIEFANMALKQLKATAGRESIGVRQKRLQVLWSTKMPAVLVEVEYMCNPKMEKWLKSKKNTDKCAEALFEAFNKYYKRYK